jgi:hypothetical protein
LTEVIANVLLAQGDAPPAVVWVVVFAVVGAVTSMYLQRYFIIVGTAFGGAWTILLGALTLVGEIVAPVEATGEPVWVAYLLDPMQQRQWVLVAWFALGVAGTAVQLGITGGERGRVVRRKKS